MSDFLAPRGKSSYSKLPIVRTYQKEHLESRSHGPSVSKIKNQVSAAVGAPRAGQVEEDGSQRQVMEYGLCFLLKCLWASRGSTLTLNSPSPSGSKITQF